MSDLSPYIAITIGFVFGIIIMLLINLVNKRKHNSDIAFLQFERDHREQIRESKVFLHKTAYRDIFWCLFLLGLALIASFVLWGIPSPAASPELDPTISQQGAWVKFVPLLLWLAYTALSFLRFKRFSNVNSYMQAVNKIDAKIIKARKKMEKKK